MAKKISVAQLKRTFNHGAFIDVYNCNANEFSSEWLDSLTCTVSTSELFYSDIKFNSVDMIRNTEDNDFSYCRLKGATVFENDSAIFITKTNYDNSILVIMYMK